MKKKYYVNVTETKTYTYEVIAEDNNEAIDEAEYRWSEGYEALYEGDLSHDSTSIDRVEKI